MTELYRDEQITAEDKGGMLRIKVTPKSLGDGVHTDAWLDIGEARKLAMAIHDFYHPLSALFDGHPLRQLETGE